jgi:hypothetical protein
MEKGAIIAVVVAVIAAIGLVYYLGTLGHQSSKGTTTIYTGPHSTVPVTTTIPAVVQFYDINVQYVFQGSQIQNGVNCTYASYTYVDGSQSKILNGSQIFYLNYPISSTMCPMTVKGVTVNTPGFAVMSTVPNLPLSLPPNSQAMLQINMRAPNVNFYGPLTITIYYT